MPGQVPSCKLAWLGMVRPIVVELERTIDLVGDGIHEARTCSLRYTSHRSVGLTGRDVSGMRERHVCRAGRPARTLRGAAKRQCRDLDVFLGQPARSSAAMPGPARLARVGPVIGRAPPESLGRPSFDPRQRSDLPRATLCMVEEAERLFRDCERAQAEMVVVPPIFDANRPIVCDEASYWTPPPPRKTPKCSTS